MATEENQTNKLYRSRADRYLGGVCGGIGQYFNFDSNLVRIIFVILTFFGGLGLILYIAALIIVPENPNEESKQQPAQGMNNTILWGSILVIIGSILLLKEIGIFQYFYLHDLSISTIWAVFLIAIGGAILYAQYRKGATTSDEEASDNDGDLKLNIYRSRTDRKIAGICGGIAKYFNIDSTLVRLAWILATLISAGLGILIYILFIFVFPEESTEQTA